MTISSFLLCFSLHLLNYEQVESNVKYMPNEDERCHASKTCKIQEDIHHSSVNRGLDNYKIYLAIPVEGSAIATCTEGQGVRRICNQPYVYMYNWSWIIGHG